MIQINVKRKKKTFTMITKRNMKQSVRDISHSFFKALMQNITTERHSYLIKTQTSFMLFDSRMYSMCVLFVFLLVCGYNVPAL